VSDFVQQSSGTLLNRRNALACSVPLDVLVVEEVIRRDIKIQRLWASQCRRFHAERIDLSKSSLLRIVMTINGIIEVRGRAAIVEVNFLLVVPVPVSSASSVVPNGSVARVNEFVFCPLVMSRVPSLSG
jgi:hypothetical protein